MINEDTHASKYGWWRGNKAVSARRTAIGVLARRDGGNIGKSTLDFISTIPQGAVGVAAYLTDCSLDFLRRQPLFWL